MGTTKAGLSNQMCTHCRGNIIERREHDGELRRFCFQCGRDAPPAERRPSVSTRKGAVPWETETKTEPPRKRGRRD